MWYHSILRLSLIWAAVILAISASCLCRPPSLYCHDRANMQPFDDQVQVKKKKTNNQNNPFKKQQKSFPLDQLPLVLQQFQSAV